MSNYSPQDQRYSSQDQRHQPDQKVAHNQRSASQDQPYSSQRDDNYGYGQANRDAERDWQDDRARNYGDSNFYGSSNFGGSPYRDRDDEQAYGANRESFYEPQQQANQNMPSYRASRSQHRGEPWPRNEDRENYAAVADNRYSGRPHRYYDDEARAANRFARPQYGRSFFNQNQNSFNQHSAERQMAPMPSYFNPNPAALDPRSGGNYYDAGGSGYGRDLGYAQNYSPNYSPSYSQGYDRWQSSGNVQGWQERDDAQVGAFGMQSHRGKGPRGYTRSDERIREDVCERLSEHHYIDASAIAVEVKDGVVTLEGSVDDRWQKYQAEDLIDATSGVKDINNRLTVKRAAQNEPRSETADKGRAATTAKS